MFFIDLRISRDICKYFRFNESPLHLHPPPNRSCMYATSPSTADFEIKSPHLIDNHLS